MAGHKHAEAMMEYAKDAQVTKTPWDRWEYCMYSNTSKWYVMSTHPNWCNNLIYRRKRNLILTQNQAKSANSIIRCISSSVGRGGLIFNYDSDRIDIQLQSDGSIFIENVNGRTETYDGIESFNAAYKI